MEERIKELEAQNKGYESQLGESNTANNEELEAEKQKVESLTKAVEDEKKEKEKAKDELATVTALTVSLKAEVQAKNDYIDSLSKQLDEKQQQPASSVEPVEKVDTIVTLLQQLVDEPVSGTKVAAFAEELGKYCSGDEKNEELELFKTIGSNDMTMSVFLFLVFKELTGKELVERVEDDGTMKNQLLLLQLHFYFQIVKLVSTKFEGFLESMMKDNQCFERRKGAEFEQVAASFVMKTIKVALRTLKEMGVPDRSEKQLIAQIVNTVSTYIIELLTHEDKYVTCAKGLQLKFFFNIVEADMSQTKELQEFTSYLQPAIEASSLLVIDHSYEMFKSSEMIKSLPHLTESVIYAILSRFQSDSLNDQHVDQRILDSLDKNDYPLPTCDDLVKLN